MHDSGDTGAATILGEDMVLAVELGLYFAKKTEDVPACGIRTEDEVLVTRSGATVLSGGIPKTADEVEGMMRF